MLQNILFRANPPFWTQKKRIPTFGNSLKCRFSVGLVSVLPLLYSYFTLTLLLPYPDAGYGVLIFTANDDNLAVAEEFEDVGIGVRIGTDIIDALRAIAGRRRRIIRLGWRSADFEIVVFVA